MDGPSVTGGRGVKYMKILSKIRLLIAESDAEGHFFKEIEGTVPCSGDVPSLQRRAEKIYSRGIRIISIRLFIALPSGVSLSEIGLYSP